MSRLPNLPLQLRVSPLKMLALLLVSLAFVCIGLLMLHDQPIMGASSIAFFGLGVLVAVVSLLPGSSYLELNRDGFVVSTLYRKSFISWAQVKEFQTYRMQHSERVGWTYAPMAGVASVGRRLSTTLAGVEGGLPDNYGMKAEELAGLMNAQIQAHRDRERAHP